MSIFTRNYFYCVSHQWVGITVTLSALFVKALSGGGVSIKAHVLWAELQQNWPIRVLMRSCPWKSLQNPQRRVLPCSSATVELNKHKQIDNRCIVCFYKLRDMERQERTTLCEVTSTVKFNKKNISDVKKADFTIQEGKCYL